MNPKTLKRFDEKVQKPKLSDEEREFIKTILKFGNYVSGTGNGIVKFIMKRGYYLQFCFSEFHSSGVYIDKNIYFRGINEDEEYTLKELGVE